MSELGEGGSDDGRLASLLAGAGCEALLVLARSAADVHLAPFARAAHLGICGLLAVRDERPILAYTTLMEREEAAATGLALLGPVQTQWRRLRRELGEERALARLAAILLQPATRPGARIALAGHVPPGCWLEVARDLESAGGEAVSGDPILRRWRKRKTLWQLDAVRHAAHGTQQALRRVAHLLAAAERRQGELWLAGERLTCGHLRRAVAEVLAAHELEQPEGNIVSAGRDAGIPHSRSAPERVLRPGETILVDLFPRGTLFADCTRTFVVGQAPEAVHRAFQATLEVLAAAHQAARAGVAGRDLHEAASARFAAAGYPTLRGDTELTSGFVHTLGHGVGFELHEEPGFRVEPEDGGRLETGDIFTLEPGLYDPNAGWGIRLEDLVHLGPEGPENLTTLPYDLDPRAWQEPGPSQPGRKASGERALQGSGGKRRSTPPAVEP